MALVDEKKGGWGAIVGSAAPEGDTRLRWTMLAALFFVGAVIGGLSLVLPHPDEFDTAGLWSNVAIAFGGAALALFAAGARLPTWAAHLAVLFGTVLVSRAVYLSADPDSYYVFYYIWVGLWSFFFLGRAGGIAQAGGIGVAYAIVLAELPKTTPVALWLMVMTTVAIGALLVDVVVRRLRTAAQQSEQVALERAGLMAQLEKVARTDDLTGLPNRRAWNEELARELSRAKRDGTPLCVGVIDLDRFKVFNDRFGHQAGDRLLKEIAATWRAQLRATDVIARYGGEEFAVALPGCDIDDATELLDRLREATPREQTCSVGIARWDDEEGPERLVDRADTALYAAKAAGRDRVASA